MFTDADVIHTYTRADALRDGVLVDVSGQAREAGFRIPVALTARVWVECVAWPETESLCQDESGRLWDVVFMAAAAARRAARRGEGDRTTFDLHVVPRGGTTPKLTSLVLHIGPGDRGECVGTLMRPGED
ncbi:MAG: hypothetical protein BGP24_19985 [Lysobacterales bacterium 69-70]|nr:hypothetical protein [Xanthomonadaceae bacterium]ODU35765.1 MAG: hypothetical protein ABS97_02775 [Xanthomonadaceae bacterium SCN 69-320]ODV17497.1 MAG: hypothetical protein ABT27_17300 [Xanthomonadaceae bacterium SCN 69-25]OJY97253.1 MAG: hypothetical protein BGP24_19985 [Xanthomonadales bacterium 69-70]